MVFALENDMPVPTTGPIAAEDLQRILAEDGGMFQIEGCGIPGDLIVTNDTRDHGSDRAGRKSEGGLDFCEGEADGTPILPREKPRHAENQRHLEAEKHIVGREQQPLARAANAPALN